MTVSAIQITTETIRERPGPQGFARFTMPSAFTYTPLNVSLFLDSPVKNRNLLVWSGRSPPFTVELKNVRNIFVRPDESKERWKRSSERITKVYDNTRLTVCPFCVCFPLNNTTMYQRPWLISPTHCLCHTTESDYNFCRFQIFKIILLVCVCAHVCEWQGVRVCVCMHANACVCVCYHPCAQAHMKSHLCTHTYTHMYANTHTHSYRHTHTHELSIEAYKYERVMSHVWMKCAYYLQKSRTTHMNEPFHAHEWVLSHTWMSQVTCEKNGGMSLVAHLNESSYLRKKWWKPAKKVVEIDFCDGWAQWTRFECDP